MNISFYFLFVHFSLHFPSIGMVAWKFNYPLWRYYKSSVLLLPSAQKKPYLLMNHCLRIDCMKCTQIDFIDSDTWYYCSDAWNGMSFETILCVLCTAVVFIKAQANDLSLNLISEICWRIKRLIRCDSIRILSVQSIAYAKCRCSRHRKKKCRNHQIQFGLIKLEHCFEQNKFRTPHSIG